MEQADSSPIGNNRIALGTSRSTKESHYYWSCAVCNHLLFQFQICLVHRKCVPTEINNGIQDGGGRRRCGGRTRQQGVWTAQCSEGPGHDSGERHHVSTSRLNFM